MALNGSGPISLAGTTAGQSIEIENGGNGTTQISLNDTAVRSLAGVPSGQITMPTNFWGKANAFTFSFAGGTDVNLRDAAVAAGWNQSSKVIATNNGTVQSSSTGTPALTISGAFPGGLEFTNAGLIVGRGGNGGNGGNDRQVPGGPGGSAGTALYVTTAVSITNNSSINGGGGGGGGGGTAFYNDGAGGGGGGGIGVSSGGSSLYNPGTPGTTTAAGPGGPGRSGTKGRVGGPGGAGGGYGSNGSSGGGSSDGTGGGGGGAGGPAVVGNSNITWVAVGTRNGGIS